MIKKLRLSAYEGAIRMGGYMGWYLTVLYVCRLSLANFGKDLVSLLDSIDLTYLGAGASTLLVLAVVMLFFDFEGILSHKWLRWLPGLLMAESGVALSLTEAKTMTAYSAIAGVASALGLLAVLSCLLKVKVGQRIFSVCAGLAIGGAVRVAAGAVINFLPDRNGRIIVASAIGLIAALTVHSGSFSKDTMPPVAYAEAKPAFILSKLPGVYIWMLLLGGAFCYASGVVEADGIIMLPPTFASYELLSYAAFAITAIALAFIVKPHALASLFAVSSVLSAAACVLLALPNFASTESVVFTVLSFAATACFKACMFLLVVTFSLDRPHPLFFAVSGGLVMVCSELLGKVLEIELSSTTRTILWILLTLVPLGGFFLSRAMRFSGFSQEQLERRHFIRKLIARTALEMELSDKERSILDFVVLDGYTAEMLPDKLGLSRNTIKAQLRALCQKFSVAGLDELSVLFAEKIETEEKALLEERESSSAGAPSLLERLAEEPAKAHPRGAVVVSEGAEPEVSDTEEDACREGEPIQEYTQDTAAETPEVAETTETAQISPAEDAAQDSFVPTDRAAMDLMISFFDEEEETDAGELMGMIDEAVEENEQEARDDGYLTACSADPDEHIEQSSKVEVKGSPKATIKVKRAFDKHKRNKE